MRRVLTFILFFIFCLVTQAQDNRANAADFNKKANQAFNIVHSNSNRDSLTILPSCNQWRRLFVKKR